MIGDVFYQARQQACHQMRSGYSSITLDRIDAGIRLLGRDMARLQVIV